MVAGPSKQPSTGVGPARRDHGQVRLRVDKFALTSNNTGAILGEDTLYCPAELPGVEVRATRMLGQPLPFDPLHTLVFDGNQ